MTIDTAKTFTASSAGDEFRKSWRIVAAASVGYGLGFAGVALYSFGAVVTPLATEFGWSLASVGGWTLCANLGYCCVAPFVGRLTDRFGVRSVVLLAIPLLAAALAGAASIRGRLWVLDVSGLVVGCVGAGTTAIVYGRAVSSWFDAGRGTALGLMSAGLGLGSMIAPFVMQTVTDRFGWRAGFLAMALLAVSTLPLIFFWLSERGGEIRSHASASVAVGDTRALAMRRPVFWLLGGGYVLSSLANGGIVVYLIPFLTDAGISRPRAAAFAGLLGISSMCGRLIGGFLVDRLHVAVVCTVFLIGQAAACIALGMHLLHAAPFLIPVIGLALGAEANCVTYSTARYFGLKAFSELCGIIGVLGGIGQGLGSIVFGHAVGANGAFGAAFMTCAALLITGAALFYLVGRYPYPGFEVARGGEPACVASN